ncbi:beta-lactamase family protein [Bradyrhizobium sp. ISRA443]|uniref:serine hydrolase domain-containing protein n=1 Tax=unclassified Bradyrhizobium TaxID=2631580 RepID=UPI00247ADFCA|nr:MULTISPECIES: serine hydrolase domain-containing protein [unclassified Bradyrhizobium]WGR93968.1 beta-lactamase family protein [Bradyrhizobium sp. ISRA435]WGR98595.1 beta-lactamase family protein [Bradyrhizobium sp. ISRA436]WGS05484.1 beta-lactamase family protein [Bradyrhizobium sp. ISRA437]WGS12371.1 beta-lactamase family protein [Bradyrhizobium sp. ISRA443]
MRRFLMAAAAVLAAGATHAAPLPEAKPDQVGFSKEGLARLDDFFAREIAAKRVPGAVVAIARDGKLVHYKAYGQLDAAKGTPMPIDAVFALASMTKPMTAVAGLTLMEQGRLPLQAKLTEYYPAFGEMKVGVPQPDGSLKIEPQASPIHIHDLYRHTSGLMYGGRPDSSSPLVRLYPDGTAPALEGDTEAFIERITKLPLAHQPSTAFEYGFSIDVLGAVVEKVSGQRLGDYLAANVWGPLGMKDATFHPSEAQRARLAHPFANDPLTGKPQAIKLLDAQTKFDCGGACSFATVGDYLRFGQMLLNGGELDGKRILSPKTVHHMTSNHLGPEIKNNVANVEPHRGGFGFGLGVAVRTSEGLSSVPGNPGEFTWNGAYGTQFFCDPKERLVLVVGTAAPGQLRKYYRENVQDIVYGAMVK